MYSENYQAVLKKILRQKNVGEEQMLKLQDHGKPGEISKGILENSRGCHELIIY